MWRILGVLITALPMIARCQENITLEENDPRLLYLPPKSYWKPNRNPQPGPNGTSISNYFHGGGYISIALAGASVTLTFNGSYIAYYSDIDPKHGRMEIDLDGNTTDITTHSGLSWGTPQLRLFEAHVDPNVANHKIVLTNNDNKIMALDYFLYTPASPTTAKHSVISSLTLVSPTAGGPTVESKISTGRALSTLTIVLITLLSITTLLLTGIGVRRFRTVRRQASSREPVAGTTGRDEHQFGVVDAGAVLPTATAPGTRSESARSPTTFHQLCRTIRQFPWSALSISSNSHQPDIRPLADSSCRSPPSYSEAHITF